MPSPPTNWRYLVPAAFAVATLAVVGPLTATPKLDGREAFRRPADLVESERTAKDPIWVLGQTLFFDPRLSGSGHTSCATCHRPDQAWSDSHPLAVGDNRAHLGFKTPTLLNIGWLDRLGWTGSFADTASVALFAMNSAANMNMPLPDLVKWLRSDPDYVAKFKAAFSHDLIDDHDVGLALTRYVDSIASTESPFDHWVEGDEAALTPAAKRGFALFIGKGRCAECHSGWSFTDGSFHDVGVAATDAGRGRFFKTSVKLQHAFKTPTLRGVADRAPYMHNGSKASLEEVIDLYDRGGIERPSRAEPIRPLHLTAEEKSDLKAFLMTLSSGTEYVIHP